MLLVIVVVELADTRADGGGEGEGQMPRCGDGRIDDQRQPIGPVLCLLLVRPAVHHKWRIHSVRVGKHNRQVDGLRKRKQIGEILGSARVEGWGEHAALERKTRERGSCRDGRRWHHRSAKWRRRRRRLGAQEEGRRAHGDDGHVDAAARRARRADGARRVQDLAHGKAGCGHGVRETPGAPEGATGGNHTDRVHSSAAFFVVQLDGACMCASLVCAARGGGSPMSKNAVVGSAATVPSPGRSPAKHPPLPAGVHPPWPIRIGPSARAGLGVLATRRIPRGTIVFEEEPIVVINQDPRRQLEDDDIRPLLVRCMELTAGDGPEQRHAGVLYGDGVHPPEVEKLMGEITEINARSRLPQGQVPL